MSRELDEGLELPIASILWATPRLQADCQELVVISDQLAMKYSKEFVQACRANKLNNVNEKLIHKLSVQVLHDNKNPGSFPREGDCIGRLAPGQIFTKLIRLWLICFMPASA